ncbi:ABC transporter permease [Desulfitobacterium chlororespirans]|uniref:Peptide/nickel transport system permease protein n=1 Tax=Desulfitobacterium chlororespirans DSM 11544 TaxID=1121395 RepID=A0A1M7URS5_9FIRM|nr:ABC transporter permease [Desulfitobacterium chlororespirans]SHN85650.1 peptide/nickel transport system permease protein [Desulfitobacterium chlororespirans DSM 11544]
MKKHYLSVLLVIICINFFLPRLMPGDPFLYLSVEDGNVSAVFSQEQIDHYKDYYGLAKPLPIQFWQYITGLLQGNLGYSIYYNSDVAEMILTRIPWTFLIVITSLALSSLVGTVLGALSSWQRDKPVDKLLYGAMVIVAEIPSFLLGVLFLFVFAAQLQWFPLSGGSTVFASFASRGEQLGDLLHHAALPVLTLALTRIGGFYLLSRNSMLTVLSKDYIRTAKAKGLKQRSIIFRHALRNALPPVVARIFMSMGAMFGGAVLIETVFAYPGVGRLMREAVLNRDYVLIQGIFLAITLTVLLMNWIAELVYRKLDPRVE